MGYPLKQSQTAQPLLFFMVDSADHIAAKTGLTPTVTISKNGGAFASPSGAVTEIANGWYKVAGNATDTGTLGPLVLHASATGADPYDTLFEVVAFDPQSATSLGLSNLDATVSTRLASASYTAPLDAAATRTAVGLATANLDTQLSTIDDFLDTEVAAIKAKTDNLPSDPADASDIAAAFATVNATLSTISGYLDTEIAAIKTVTDQFTAAQSEPTAVPAANASPLAKIAFLAALARNRVTQTSTQQVLRNSGDSGNIGTATVSDDGTTFARGSWS